jgi:CubicO group peptidase (beta-lactamase class C family)
VPRTKTREQGRADSFVPRSLLSWPDQKTSAKTNPLATVIRGWFLCTILMVGPWATGDWREDQRQSILHGVQAVLMCNGLFTSHRSLDAVFAQELALLRPPRFDPALGTASEGPYRIDQARKTVTVGTQAPRSAVSAVFRDGFGCVVLPPGQLPTDDVLGSLPVGPGLEESPSFSEEIWPFGDQVTIVQSETVNAEALKAAGDWAFNLENPEQVTTSLLITSQDAMIYERYAPGFDANTRQRTWSVAKSIAATLIGQRVQSKHLALDSPLNVDFLPKLKNSELDPRRLITLRQVLNMSSGLEPVDNSGMEYQNGSGLAYWAGDSASVAARSRGLVRMPGSYWDYENYETLLAVDALKQTFKSTENYLAFPRQALLDPLGMKRTLIGVDRFGDFILSSQVYSSARDLARFGLLHLAGGLWGDQRLVSEDWIEFVRSPAPAPNNPKQLNGGHWWLVPSDRFDVPKDAYCAAGHRGQFVIVVPSKELVIVRRGLDFGRQGFDHWDLTREILKAFEA